MAKIVLTADRGSFTEYGGVSTLGYVACMPSRVMPKRMPVLLLHSGNI